MAMRNFWIDCEIDDDRTELSGGPGSKEGGMTGQLYMRNKGSVEKVLSFEGREDEGRLTMIISVCGHDDIIIERER